MVDGVFIFVDECIVEISVFRNVIIKSEINIGVRDFL